ncbi:hypothetical protein [Microbacterium sp. Yaish 1]|uniref:hypothetical protein n=1 Tax=Microbacterium sp. Yaish 1 TaxID=2025014 RepID=UPI000B93FF75|nr:hypothetical protein [Microbacterium sp. Yaish 1]OYC95385.1 hypothetical protein CI089_11730 [Microbacterium sp. Yaish 1]
MLKKIVVVAIASLLTVGGLVGCVRPATQAHGAERLADSFEAMYASWLEDPELTERDVEILTEAQATGRVTHVQYEDSLERLVDCMADAGYDLDLTTYPSGIVNVQPPAAVADPDRMMAVKHGCERATSIHVIMGYEMQQANPDLYADPSLRAFTCLRDGDLIAASGTVEDVHRFMFASMRGDFPFDSDDLGVEACFYGAGMSYDTGSAAG